MRSRSKRGRLNFSACPCKEPRALVVSPSASVGFRGPEGSLLLLEALHFERAELKALVERPAARRRGDGRLFILISLDTFRGDHIRALGCDECTTPNLDALVAEAQVFDPHYAASTWTKPSHASLLTGLFPFAHMMLNPEDLIDTRLPLVSEALAKSGFTTTGVVSNVVWLDGRWGFARGFDRYLVTPWSASQKIRYVLARALEFRQSDHFVFLHTFEPHSDLDQLPYEGPGASPEAVEQRFGLENYGCREGFCGSNLVTALKDGQLQPQPQEDEALRFLYRSGVQDTDRAVGELIAGLKTRGLWERALVVVTSDHGEGLLENGRIEHGQTWETVLRVPLLIKWPNGLLAGETFNSPTSAVDLMPTLMSAANPTADLPKHLPGNSLLPPSQRLLEQKEDRPVFSGEYNWSVTRGRYKLRLSFTGEKSLYDLESDPAETEDLAAQLPSVVSSLEVLLGRRHAEDVRLHEEHKLDALPSAELSDEDRAKLEALGYLQ